MAEVVRYVDPDATGVGNGTSWTDAYTSLNAWEAAEQTDLVSDGDWHHVYVRASSNSPDTTETDINGWTTGSSNYILIEAASGDEALKSGWSSTRYRLIVTDPGDFSLSIKEEYFRIKGIQLGAVYSSANYKAVLGTFYLPSSSDIRIYDCRIQTSGGAYKGVNSTDADFNIKVWNTVFHGITDDGVTGTFGTVEIFNCIIANCSDHGIYASAGTWTIKNTAVFNTADDIDMAGAGSSTVDYCASDDGDGTNAVAPSGSDWDNEFTDSASGDFTLEAGGNCENGGTTDPGSGLYDTDMEGDDYDDAGGWSIGVDEISGGAPSVSIPVILHHLRQQGVA